MYHNHFGVAAIERGGEEFMDPVRIPKQVFYEDLQHIISHISGYFGQICFLRLYQRQQRS